MNAVIIGCGIGGLTAAIALQRVGTDVHVYERATDLREVGAGISLWSNATRGLEHLGLKEAVRAQTLSSTNASIRSWRGERLSTERH